MTLYKGDWALVTGASSGIGWEFAKQIAGRGMHVVVVARRRERLKALRHEIHSNCKEIHVVEVPMDLTRPDAAAELRSQLDEKGIRIRLLVNNAGAGRWGRMERHTSQDYSKIIALNSMAVVSLCREFFAHLSSHPTSAIINVSSQAAIQPVPFMAVYGATKAFVHSFSLALYQEWKDFGIHVQTLVPGPTKSEFDERAGAYASRITERSNPSQCVDLALRSLEGKSPLVVAAKGVLTQRLFANLLPTRLVLTKVAEMFKPPES